MTNTKMNMPELTTVYSLIQKLENLPPNLELMIDEGKIFYYNQYLIDGSKDGKWLELPWRN